MYICKKMKPHQSVISNIPQSDCNVPFQPYIQLLGDMNLMFTCSICNLKAIVNIHMKTMMDVIHIIVSSSAKHKEMSLESRIHKKQ